MAKTRAQILREKVVIRIPSDEAGQYIERIFFENNIVFVDANWKDVSKNWLIATMGNEVIGCLLVIPAKPLGLLEFLLVRPSVPFKFRAIAMQKLALQGLTTLQLYGSSYLCCTVDVENKPFFDVLRKFNFMPTLNTTTMIKRLIP